MGGFSNLDDKGMIAEGCKAFHHVSWDLNKDVEDLVAHRERRLWVPAALQREKGRKREPETWMVEIG